MTDISRKRLALGEWIGTPLHEERVCPDGMGRYQTFRRDSDGMITSIHFHPSTGAFETHGAIREKWNDYGFEHSFLGYPISDEEEHRVEGNLIGRHSRFQGGVILWIRDTNTRIVFKYGADGRWIVHQEEEPFHQAMPEWLIRSRGVRSAVKQILTVTGHPQAGDLVDIVLPQPDLD
jgi:hypothetical protein